MAATTAQKIVSQSPGRLRAYKVAATINIPQGTMVFITAAGFATNVIAAGVNTFAGIAKAGADNTSGADGDITVECYTLGTFELPLAGGAQTDVGELAYASDNYTATKTSASMSKIGRIEESVSSTVAAIGIDTLQT